MERAVTYLIVAFTLACVCSAGPASDGPALVSSAASNADFGYDLYRVAGAAGGNLCVSPFSVGASLFTAFAGARTVTETEMAAVMHLSGDRAALCRSFSELQSHIGAIARSGDVELSLANSIWCERGRALLDEFMVAVGSGRPAEVRYLDFRASPEAARSTINAWAREATRGAVGELVPRGRIDASTALVICDAVHFKGSWAWRFKREYTKERDFHVTPERSVTVQMMATRMDVRMRRYDDVDAVELPYEGGELAMLLLMPVSADGMQSLEARLSAETVGGWLTGLRGVQPAPVMVGIPRFRLSCQLELAGALEELGMRSAFHDADFSGIDGTRELFISDVLHVATLSVDEEGAEAASSSAVVMKKGSPVFIADRPFLFLVFERRTGTVLFLGRLVDPTA
jgi:serpin B